MDQTSENRGDSATKMTGVVTANVREVPKDIGTAVHSVQPEIQKPELQKQAEETLEKQKKQARTPGLKLFDVFLYPVLTNFSVFAISVAATYLTSRGGDRTKEGKLIYGKVGEFFQKRGDWLMDKFKGMGMNHNQADMSKMVFFSFMDGSMMAPAVKMLEDRRESIGRWIDDRLGTTPADPSVYKAEPKQTWLSVLGGRFATVAIVVPTAVALDKTGLNDKLFTQPGIRMGEELSKNKTIAKWAGKLDIKELSKISLFEFFYTSVCTTGLYFSSRFFARQSTVSEKPVEATANPDSQGAETQTPPAKSFVSRYQDERAQKQLSLQPGH